jgi:hypothetical protein
MTIHRYITLQHTNVYKWNEYRGGCPFVLTDESNTQVAIRVGYHLNAEYNLWQAHDKQKFVRSHRW